MSFMNYDPLSVPSICFTNMDVGTIIPFQFRAKKAVKPPTELEDSTQDS